MTNEYIKNDDGKRTDKGQALNKIQQGYKQIAKENGEEVSKPTVAETLKKRHDEGMALSGMELLIVGQYEADLKREEIDKQELREAEGHHHNDGSAGGDE